MLKKHPIMHAIFALLVFIASIYVVPSSSAASSKNPYTRKASSLILTSTAFPDGGMIPSKYTRQGEDASPPIEWYNVPDGTESLVLIVDDPDAPDPEKPKMTFVHWIVLNISPSAGHGIPEGLSEITTLGEDAMEGLNDWENVHYGGPSPPIGKHRYFFKLYALDSTLDFEENSPPTKAQVESSMEGHILGQTEMIGMYEKKDDLSRR